ncbi:MAG: ribonuclease Z [Thermoplasmata archaeon]
MKLIFLGTGGSYPSPQRNVVSIALKVNGEMLLFDCGEGTQRQLMKSSASFMDVNKVFITHFHGDHILGLPGLIQSMNLNDREKKLEICGPRGTEKMLQVLLRVGYFRPNFTVYVQDVKPGARLRFDKYSVSAVEADHNVPSLAFVFQEKERPGRFDKQKALDLGVPEGPLFAKIQRGERVEVEGKTIHPGEILGPPRRGRKIVYSGDTKPSPIIEKASMDADVLIHEGTLESALSDKALQFDHSTVKHAAEIADRARVKKLFIIHISPRYDKVEGLLKEAREVFEESYIPSDLDEYEF